MVKLSAGRVVRKSCSKRSPLRHCYAGNSRALEGRNYPSSRTKLAMPGCGAASLTLIEDTFRTVFDESTNTAMNQPNFYSEFVTGRFVCLVRCSKSRCCESCAVSGNFRTYTDHDPDGWNEYEAGRPTSITPPPPLISMPRACPDPVRAEVTAAFSLYWNDLASSLNRIRNALELVLDDLKVPKSSRSKTSRRLHRLSLHQRIEKLESQRPKLKEICDRMMAVKHLGNASSHPGVEVTANDVFDGFDILERVFGDMYSEHPSLLAQAVKEINRRKGPRKGPKPPF